MVIKEVIFYNHYGNGDIFVAREFVKEIMRNLPEAKHYFAHSKDPYINSDILKHRPLDVFCEMRSPFILVDESLYINTWIGYAYGKYVLPGVVCRLDKFKQMYNDTLEKIGLPFRLNQPIENYIPEIGGIDSEYKNNITDFVYSIINKKLVLICNGNVQSNQAENFDFTPVIEKLAEENPNIIFLVTEYFYTNFTNIIYTGSIFGKGTGSDLKEIGYLSKYVDIIIGRSSGPFVFCQTRTNYSNANLKILSFTYVKEAGHMAFFPVNAKLHWSPATNFEGVYNAIKQLL